MLLKTTMLFLFRNKCCFWGQLNFEDFSKLKMARNFYRGRASGRNFCQMCAALCCQIMISDDARVRLHMQAKSFFQNLSNFLKKSTFFDFYYSSVIGIFCIFLVSDMFLPILTDTGVPRDEFVVEAKSSHVQH